MARLFLIFCLWQYSYCQDTFHWFSDGDRSVEVNCLNECQQAQIRLRSRGQEIREMNFTKASLESLISKPIIVPSPVVDLKKLINKTCEKEILCQINLWTAFIQGLFPVSRLEFSKKVVEFLAAKIRLSRVQGQLRQYLRKRTIQSSQKTSPYTFDIAINYLQNQAGSITN